MKKILSALLVTAIAGTAFAAAPTALAKTTTYILGDTTKDGINFGRYGNSARACRAKRQ